MSNDPSFSLRFRHEKKRYLEELRQYAEQKKARWDKFNATGKDVKVLMKLVGAKKPNHVVSWGFEFGKLVKYKGGYCLLAWAWANQNSWNMHITGDDGELADLVARFPELLIEGEYESEYGYCGSLSVGSTMYTGDDIENEDTDPFVELEITSSAISSARYYHSIERLILMLDSGLCYAFDEVPRSVVKALTEAKSAGRYFNREIKPRYRHIKIDAFCQE